MIARTTGLVLMALSTVAAADQLDTITRQFPRRGERVVHIELNLGAGQVFLFRGLRDLAADVRVMFDQDKHTATVTYEKIDSEEGKLTLTSRRRKDTILRHFDLRASRENIWRVELSPRIAYTVQGNLGAVSGELDMTGLPIDGLDLDIGASTLSILFNEKNPGHIPRMRIDAGASRLTLKGLGNAHFDRLDLNGGAGQFTLDFAGDLDHHAAVELSVGVGTITLAIPQTVGAHIEASDGVLSSVTLEGDFKEVREDEYQNQSHGKTKGQLEIDLDAALGGVTIKEIEEED